MDLNWDVDMGIQATGGRLSECDSGSLVLVMSGRFSRRLCVVTTFDDNDDVRRLIVDLETGEAMEAISDYPVVRLNGPYRITSRSKEDG